MGKLGAQDAMWLFRGLLGGQEQRGHWDRAPRSLKAHGAQREGETPHEAPLPRGPTCLQFTSKKSNHQVVTGKSHPPSRSGTDEPGASTTCLQALPRWGGGGLWTSKNPGKEITYPMAVLGPEMSTK